MTSSPSVKILAAIGFIVALVAVAAFASSASDPDASGSDAAGGRLPTYSVTLYKEGDGLVYGSGTYRSGASASLVATPSEGYRFVGWYSGGSLVGSDATYKLIVKSDQKITAKFEKATCVIEARAGDPNRGFVSGGGAAVQYGSAVYLNASPAYGYQFSGWQIGGVTVSSSSGYRHVATGDATVVAAFSIIHDASFSVFQQSSASPSVITSDSKYNVDVSSRTWAFSDAISGATMGGGTYFGGGQPSYSMTVSASGGKAVKVTQTVRYSDGQTSTSSSVAVVDATVTKTYSWRYQSDAWYSIITDLINLNNKSAKWDVPMKFSWYYSALSSSLPRSNGYSVISSYVTHSDPVIKSMADALYSYSSGMSSIDRANFVLKFVQSIPYDDYEKGTPDYWKLPAETLWEQRGDCEDHAFLFAALMKAMGYRVILHYIYCYDSRGNLTNAHIAAGVDVSGGGGEYTTVDGVRYFYCEATATQSAGWRDYASIGYKPTGFVIKSTYKV
ncbi:MAG: hypothetical protein LBG62_01550 [Candidatus Methanoplasma sp.]|jgi:hypothetical protein|nr:hypothetical protein [Candidatus Methanoplasma sp.]